VSQISNPAYATPIPARHLEAIFELCHFSAEDRREFLEAYGEAHPRRLALAQDRLPLRRLTVSVPDLGSARKNKQLDRLLTNLVDRMADLIQDDRG